MQEGVSPGTVGDALARFLDDLTIAGYSPLTVKVYGWKLRKRLPLYWPLHELTAALLRSLVAAEVRYAKPGTAASFDTMLRSFTRHLWKQGLTATNLMASVPSPKPPEPRTRALSPEQMARLWQAACELDEVGSAANAFASGPIPPNHAAGAPLSWSNVGDMVSRCRPDSITNRLLIALLRDTGLRRAEAASARFERLEGDVLSVLGKGGRWRRVLLSAEVVTLLGKHPNAGPILGGLTPSGVGKRFARIARRAGVKATAHQLRHSYFTDFVARGGSISHAVTLGGWSNDSQLTKRYARSAMEMAAIDEARRLAQER